MLTRCAYYCKLYGIIVILVLLWAFVESAPDHPVAFLSVLVLSIISIRLLWRSVRKNNVTMQTNKVSIEQRAAPKDNTSHEKKNAA